MTAAKVETLVVHVAGPVETEALGSRRVERQRCLRCDAVLRDEREHAVWWLLGQGVGVAVSGRAKVAIDRSVLLEHERSCGHEDGL